MIDTTQWRVSVGLWYCHRILNSTKKGTTADISGWVESLWSGGSGDEGGGNLTFSLVLFILLLLILSGDIELNPGPKTSSKFDSYMSIHSYFCTELCVVGMATNNLVYYICQLFEFILNN